MSPTDTMITEPDRFLARQMAKRGLPRLRLPLLLRAGARRGPPASGAAHGAEITYVFDNLPQQPLELRRPIDIPAATPTTRSVADAMHAYWVAFAKTGDPGQRRRAGLAALWRPWPGDELVEFGADGVERAQRLRQGAPRPDRPPTPRP